MNRKLLSVFIVLSLVFTVVLSSCTYVDNDSAVNESENNVTFYSIKDSVSVSDLPVFAYNEVCPEEDKIVIKEFDDEETLSNAFATEMMAGGGPDLISLSTLSIAKASPVKLMQQGKLADINELINADTLEDKLDLNQYSQEALKSGQLDNKQYFMPFFYVPNMYISTEEKLKNYLTNYDLSYEKLFEINSKVKQNQELGLFGNIIDNLTLMNNYIDNNLDLINETNNFNSDAFSNNLSQVREVTNDEQVYDEFLFDSKPMHGLGSLTSEYLAIKSTGEKPVLINKESVDGDMSANVLSAIAINQNSSDEVKQKILKFIKFALSEEYQNDIVGANVTIESLEEITDASKNTTGDIYGSGFYYPVNKNSYKALFSSILDRDFPEQSEKLTNEDVEYIEDKISSVNKIYISAYYDYYNSNVIQEPVSAYLSNSINESEFINKLQNSTQIYLEE